jgi:hypothetical protein
MQTKLSRLYTPCGIWSALPAVLNISLVGTKRFIAKEGSDKG